MTALTIYAIVLLVAVLLSDYAERSVLSTAVLFLVAGFVVGNGVLRWIEISEFNPVVSMLAELALFSVLFTDGMKVGIRDLRVSWRLPGRALLFGMPLTFVGLALLAHYVVGLTWAEAALVGAVLMPTDPVFASAIVGREEVPLRLRRLLNVESGVNDGLALPAVLVMIAVLGPAELHTAELFEELIFGILLGIIIAWGAMQLEKGYLLAAKPGYEPLHVFSIGLLVYALAKMTHANVFLAAFAAGITVASVSGRARQEFHQFGELITELLKLGAILLFGVLVTPEFLSDIHLSGWVFALLAILLVRPVAVWIALIGSELPWQEKLVAGWFGPKGFASVIYGLLILESGIIGSEWLFHLIAVVVAGSIFAHSSTDVLVAQWFRRMRAREQTQLEEADV